MLKRLELSSQQWETGDAVDTLRHGKELAQLLPLTVNAAAVVSSARQLAQMPRGPERDRVRNRLRWLEEFDRSASKPVRAEFRALIRASMEKVDAKERALALFELLQTAPHFCDDSTDTVAGTRFQDVAARAGRPGGWPRFGAATIGAFLSAASLTGLVAISALLDQTPNWDGADNAVGQFILLAFGALLSAVLAGFFYTPRLGRRLDWRRKALHAAIPAIVGGISCAIFSLLVLKGLLQELDFAGASGLATVYITMVAGSAVAAVTALVPRMARLSRDRGPGSARFVAAIASAGPAVAAVTIGCAGSVLLKIGIPSSFWAPVVTVVLAVAGVLAFVELETMPTPDWTMQKTSKQSVLWLAIAACFVPLVLMLTAMVAQPWRGADRVSVRDVPTGQEISKEVLVNREVLIDGRQGQRVDVAADPKQTVWISNDATQIKPVSGTLNLTERTAICLGRCRAKWPDLEYWLSVLVSVPRHATLKVKVIS